MKPLLKLRAGRSIQWSSQTKAECLPVDSVKNTHSEMGEIRIAANSSKFESKSMEKSIKYKPEMLV